MNGWRRVLTTLAWAVVFAIFFVDGVSAGDIPVAGKVINVRGHVQIIGITTETAIPGRLLHQCDTIVTGEDGWAGSSRQGCES
jgi:hypothetical protein